jgi:hypothetical protein
MRSVDIGTAGYSGPAVRGLVCALLVVPFVLACATPATAGGPYMLVGAADDVAETEDPGFAKQEMDLARLAGLDSIRLTETWTTGQRVLGPSDAVTLGNAVTAARFTGMRIVLSLFPFGSSVTPVTEQDRSDFAAYVVDVAKRFPLVHDFIVGNEPNLNRFWLPQFGPNGEDVAAPAYEQLLATTYDALKAVRPHATIYGGALAPRGVDKPGTGRDTHSPTTFIIDLGSAYRASGRAVPIMDAFAFHPYPENSSVGPAFQHPNSSSIGISDYPKLVGLLGKAFDGTAQRGSTLPILYDEFGIETQIPPAKAVLYTGTEPATTRPVNESTQAQMYLQAMQLAFCQKTVMGLFLFHAQDEPTLSAWQSGEFYVDGTPKSSLPAVRTGATAVHRGIVTTCPDLKLTPKVTLRVSKPTKTAYRVLLTCSLDCAYTIRLDGAPAASGTAIGRVAKRVTLRARPAHGRHAVRATVTAAANTGPPATATLTFRT